MAKSEAYNKLIHSARWRRLRKAVLSAHPVCEDCGERLATDAHHVRPCEEAVSPSAMERLMFDPSNIAALCRQCHRARHAAMGSGSSAGAKERARRQSEQAIRGLFGDAGA